ncbi:MAG: acyl-CoA dehydrogenase family protein [Microthrixaceae bacterium]
MVNGQKVWTSGAHESGLGLATVRTDPDAPKHSGITMMVIDMHAEGVEVRPLRQTSGASDFNEVFFTDVSVPDDDVVGPVDGGWTVARATLGNESVSIGEGSGRICPIPHRSREPTP